MTWTFERDGARLTCEISRDDANGGYRLVVTQPDGFRSVEDFYQPSALIERSVTVMQSLINEGWRTPAGSGLRA